MGKIAMGRVLVGGVVAAVIWWVGEGLVHGMLLGPQWHEAMKALGRTEEQMTANQGRFMMLVTLWSLLAGILGVWLYAAIRPRFGAGPKTAIVAGVVLWLAIYVAPTTVDYAMNLWDKSLMRIPVLTSLVESVLATLVGAWLYKEP